MAGTPKNSLTRRQIILIVLTVISIVITIGLRFPPSVPDKWVYLSSLATVLLFFLSLWNITHSHMEALIGAYKDLDKHVKECAKLDATVEATEKRLHSEYEKIIGHLVALGRLEQSVQNLTRLASTLPILGNYLEWLNRRYRELLVLPLEGVLVAPDPDYFSFAGMLFDEAKKSVRSTSLVDPHWYDSYQCRQYIADQVSELIRKGKTCTRYFIVNPTQDSPLRKEKTISVIKDQAASGFIVKVVHTSSYEREFDAAMIDDGVLLVMATVPSGSHQNLPEPDIVGCRCFFKEYPQHKSVIDELKGYFLNLDGKVYKCFDSSTANTATPQTVYGSL
jgi:hypothetical protein